MGTLVAKHYRTSLFLKLADHTYVECGSGAKGWKCCGGKTGGKILNSGQGSTERANQIAQPNGDAGIIHYLIDGVCHQAANRILLPARILVSAARGYRLSSAVFGTYGKSSFNQYPTTIGDIPECIASSIEDSSNQIRVSSDKDLEIIKVNLTANQKYTNKRFLDIKDQVNLFIEEVKIWVGEDISWYKLEQLENAKYILDKALIEDRELLNLKENTKSEFLRSFEKNTNNFQSNLADILSNKEYEKLLQLDRSEQLTLIDPVATDLAFGDGTYNKAFPES